MTHRPCLTEGHHDAAPDRWDNAAVECGESDMPVYVGIDAGGTSTQARAVRGGALVWSGSGGPANATTTPGTEFLHSLLAALEGAPTPAAVAGCFAGLATPETKRAVGDLLRGRFPGAGVRLVADYLAAMAAAGEVDVCVVAGTGSVCCSIKGGRARVSGGRGYLIGDRGSAFRYGQLLLEHALERHPATYSDRLRTGLLDVLGATDPREIVQFVHSSAAPAPLVAGLSKTLSDCASDGEPWAQVLVRQEAGVLAVAVRSHVDRFLPRCAHPSVALAGTVWQSSDIRREFTDVLIRSFDPRPVTITDRVVDPLDGAVRLATLSEDEFRALVN